MPKKYVPKKKLSVLRFLPAVLVGAIVIIGLVLSVLFVKSTQDTRQQAAEDPNKISLSLKSSKVDNDKLKIEVIANSYGYKFAALDLQGTLVETKPSDVSIEERNTLALNFIHKKISGDNTNTAFRVVEFASVDPSARTGTNGENITLFSFIITKPKDNQITVSFDTTLSSIALQNATNIRVEYPARQTLGFGGSEPDKGIHRTCNEYCADNKECDANFVCYFNKCRNPLNKNSATCAAPPKKTTTTTTTGVGGPTTSVVKVSPSPTPKVSSSPKASPGYLVDVATPTSPQPAETIPVTPFPSPVTANVTPFPSAFVSSSPSPKASPSPVATPQPEVKKSGPNWGLAIFSIIGVAVVAGGLYSVYRKR